MPFFVGQWVIPRARSNSPLRADGPLPQLPGQITAIDAVDNYLYVDFGTYGVLLVTPDEVRLANQGPKNPLGDFNIDPRYLA